MTAFLLEYGMFSAKIITLALIAVGSLFFFILMLGQRHPTGESIEVDKINDQFDAMRETLEEVLLNKQERKALKKERKKQEKEQEKKQRALQKKGENPTAARIFVLRFEGDMQASEVDNLRQSITAILSVATPADEVLAIIESAGGFVHHYGLAASQLQRIRERNIPLTASIDLVAASGGYLMASVANTIIAAPFAIVGSIGVLAQIPNFNRLLKKHAVDIEQHTAGEYKTTLTMLGENTDKAREKFKEELEDTHSLFKAFVCEHRAQLDIERLATGEHWYGARALALKLIDRIDTSDDYLMRKSEDSDIFEVRYVIHQGPIDKIISAVHGTTTKLLSVLGFRF